MNRTALSRPRHSNSKRADLSRRAPGFLQYVRGRNCILVDRLGHSCDGKIVADRFTVPMCGGPAGAHVEQHTIGWTSFEAKYGINALRIANELWAAWPSRGRWEGPRNA